MRLHCFLLPGKYFFQRLCYTPIVVAEIRTISPLDLPSSERPLDFQHISYVKIINLTEQSTEISVKLTVYFGKRPGSEFIGDVHYEFKNEECGKCESESFIEAAGQAWPTYRRRGPEVTNFVSKFLIEKWNDLEGEKQTQKRLVFDIYLDEIVVPQKRKSK